MKRVNQVIFSSPQSLLTSRPENDENKNKRDQTVTFNLNGPNHVHNDASMHQKDASGSRQRYISGTYWYKPFFLPSQSIVPQILADDLKDDSLATKSKKKI